MNRSIALLALVSAGVIATLLLLLRQAENTIEPPSHKRLEVGVSSTDTKNRSAAERIVASEPRPHSGATAKLLLARVVDDHGQPISTIPVEFLAGSEVSSRRVLGRATSEADGVCRVVTQKLEDGETCIAHVDPAYLGFVTLRAASTVSKSDENGAPVDLGVIVAGGTDNLLNISVQNSYGADVAARIFVQFSRGFVDQAARVATTRVAVPRGENIEYIRIVPNAHALQVLRINRKVPGDVIVICWEPGEDVEVAIESFGEVVTAGHLLVSGMYGGRDEELGMYRVMEGRIRLPSVPRWRERYKMVVRDKEVTYVGTWSNEEFWAAVKRGELSVVPDVRREIPISIVDEAGRYIENAELWIEHPDGSYRKIVQEAPGLAAVVGKASKIRARAKGYIPRVVRVGRLVETRAEIRLSKGKEIEGRVHCQGKPVEGAVVYWKGEIVAGHVRGFLETVSLEKTDSQGRFRVVTPSSGEGRLVVAGEGVLHREVPVRKALVVEVRRAAPVWIETPRLSAEVKPGTKVGWFVVDSVSLRAKPLAGEFLRGSRSEGAVVVEIRRGKLGVVLKGLQAAAGDRFRGTLVIGGRQEAFNAVAKEWP